MISQTECKTLLWYLLGSSAQLSESAGQVFGALTELHGRRLVTDGGNRSFGCRHHFRSGLKNRADIMSSNDADEHVITGSEGQKSEKTCMKFWLAPIRASWALGLSGWAWLPLTPWTSWGICSATPCKQTSTVFMFSYSFSSLAYVII